MRKLLLAAALLTPLAAFSAADAVFWGEDGHDMAARAAMATLPDGMPGFFAEATEQMAYLNPEPDRWRNRDLSAMDQAFSYDHYIDLENVPPAGMAAADRYAFLAVLYRETELERPERDAGFLPFHILELYQRLTTEWSLWHRAQPMERAFIEERILNDAGTLGHYVTDASQPHHTTIHFNGWNAGSTDVPNPEGFTEERDFHSRFESAFVRVHIRQGMVDEALAAADTRWEGPMRLADMEAVRSAIWEHLARSHAEVETLYRLERDHGFQPFQAPSPETVAFTSERLAEGARVLRDLWWNAYLQGREMAAAGAGNGPVPQG